MSTTRVLAKSSTVRAASAQDSRESRSERTPSGLPSAVPAGDMQRILGVSSRTLTDLARAGVVQKTARGRYALAKSVQSWGAWKAQGHTPNTLLEARKRYTTARASLAELQHRREVREMVAVSEVSALLTELASGIVLELAGIPSRLAHAVVGESSPAVIADRVRQELDRVQSNLAARWESATERYRGQPDSP